jgi:hypothetical protein
MEQTEGSYGKCLDEEKNFEVGDEAIVRRHKRILIKLSLQRRLILKIQKLHMIIHSTV